MTKYKTRRNMRSRKKNTKLRRRKNRKSRRGGSYRKKTKKHYKKRKQLKGGYNPPPMNLKFTSEQQIQEHALNQQQARGDYNAANNKMVGGAGQDDILVPAPPGVSAVGQENINKLIVSNATSESLAKYDKVGGARKKYKKRKSKKKKRRKN